MYAWHVRAHAGRGRKKAAMRYTVYYQADDQHWTESRPFRRFGDAVDMRDAMRQSGNPGAVVLTYWD
jgi:hypothetical protein